MRSTASSVASRSVAALRSALVSSRAASGEAVGSAAGAWWVVVMVGSPRGSPHELHGDAAGGIVLPQGVPDPILGHEDPREVGVARERDAEHVERLALHRIGAGVEL